MKPKRKPAETFSPGIRRAWLDDNQIALFLPNRDLTPEVKHAWNALLADTLREWPQGEPVLIMQDFSQRGLMLPHAGKVGKLNGALRDDQVAYNAIIVGGGRLMRVISRVLGLTRRQRPHCQERVFTSREAAYVWLQRVMQNRQRQPAT